MLGGADTIEDRLRRFGGVVPGFDGLRLAAALLVLWSHAFPLTGVAAAEPLHRLTGGQTTLGGVAVALFFAISGFVVTASLERSRGLLSFAGKRALRLLPALIAVVCVSAFVLGPLLTSAPLARYFGSGETWRYLLNVVFVPRYELPGVFENAPYPSAVNGSLWTLRWEVLSYAGLALLWATVLRPRRWLAPIAAAGGLIAGLVIARLPDAGPLAMFQSAAVLFGAFMCGASLYLWRDRVPLDGRIAWASAALLVAAALFGVFKEASPPALAYLCLFGSLRAWPRLRDDWSYGVYLWAFPIQQVLVVTGLGALWWSNAALGTLATLAAAALSWRLVEKPALGLKPAPRPAAEPEQTFAKAA